MSGRKKKKEADLPFLGQLLLVTETDLFRRRVILGIAIFCVVLFLADFLHLRHGKFAAEDIFGFYGFYGFAVFCVIALLTFVFKFLLQRREDYYGESDTRSEVHPTKDTDIREHGDV